MSQAMPHLELAKPSNRRKTVLILISAVLGVAVTCSLGFWQLRRADTKLAWQAEMAQRSEMAMLEGASLGQWSDSAENRAGLLHRRVRLQGNWIPEHTVFLDNRQMNGRVGFFVMTPLKLSAHAVVWVQRGWVPRHFTDRTELPAIPTTTEVVSLSGRIAPAPSKLYELGAAQTGPIRQNLDLDASRQETGLPLLEVTVVQTDAASEGLLRDWPQPATGVEKHHGYAFQWFGLAALITLLYVWFQIVRRPKSPSSPR